MVDDINYIFTWEGWLYLATVIECAKSKIVGWEMDDNYKTRHQERDQDGRTEHDLPEGAVFTATAEATIPRPS